MTLKPHLVDTVEQGYLTEVADLMKEYRSIPGGHQSELQYARAQNEKQRSRLWRRIRARRAETRSAVVKS